MFEDRIVVRVGAVFSVLLLGAVIFALQIDFRDLGPTDKIQVYFEHPGALRAQDDVQLGGRKIGTIHSIRLVTSHEARATDHPLHPDGGVVCEVWIRKKYRRWLRVNSELFVNSRGLIGESYLEVAPPPGEQEMMRPIRQGDRLRGIDPARMEKIIVTSFDNARRFGELLEELEPSMQLFREQLTLLASTIDSLSPDPKAFSKLGDSLGKASEEFTALRASLAAGDVAALQRHASALIRSASRDFRAIDQALEILSAQVNAVRARLPEEFLSRFDQVSADLQAQIATLRGSVATLQEIAHRVRTGSGTIGALINDPEFSDDAKKLGRYLKRHPWKIITHPPQ